MINIAIHDTKAETKNPSLIKQVGFTLIELSIVLVIIGLIVGGVLVGQDLIKAAEIRATVGQYEKYNAAINTFRTKYNGMPGDLVAASANAFAIGTASSTIGDGNSLIESTSGAALQVGEPTVFWQHLSNSNLVDGSYGANLTTGGVVDGTSATSTYFPLAKLGRGNYWTVGAASGLNYYLLSAFAAVPAVGGDVNTDAALTPIESYNIDSKVDDGMPNTGIVQARGDAIADTTTALATLGTNAGQSSVAGTTTGDCLQGSATATTTTNTYARNTTVGNSPNCSLRMRFN